MLALLPVDSLNIASLGSCSDKVVNLQGIREGIKVLRECPVFPAPSLSSWPRCAKCTCFSHACASPGEVDGCLDDGLLWPLPVHHPELHTLVKLRDTCSKALICYNVTCYVGFS